MGSNQRAFRCCACVGALAVAGVLSVRQPADAEVRPVVAPLDVVVKPAPIRETLPVADIGRERLEQASLERKSVTLHGIPLGDLHSATIQLEPMRVLSPKAKLVVGRPGGVDEPLDYDLSAVHTFRGKVAGIDDSSVVVVSTPRRLTGFVEIPGVGKTYKLSSVDRSGQGLPADQVSVSEVMPASSAPVDVPKCGRVSGESVVAGCCSEPSSSAIFNKRVKTVEIAIETDYDLFENFGTVADTADHVVEIMARTNLIFLRDIDVRFEVVFVRFFDTPGAEIAFMNLADPLGGYVDYWNNNMGAVARDTGAYFSGRRDLPYGGVAYLGAVCTNFGYCVCGYLRGFGDASLPEYGEYDVGVVAHELGHNFDACHTPDYCPFIDLCYPPPTVPQRGTLMSYCSQAVSGGDLAEDQWYHTRIKRVMRDFVENFASCVSYDCNQNSVDDTTDIALATSADANFDGIPDECQDCNGNSVLDPTDIATATSTDLNGNGMPDDCEPDCNGNDVPDDRDIFLGTSADVWGNGVPDECDVDCDGNLQADYNQIQSNLSLDIDRNVVLDACQDCDNDSINDLVELNGARNAWVASDVLDYIGEYHAVAGVRVKTSPAGSIASAQDLIVVDGTYVLVSNGTGNKVVRFNAHTGALLGDFVTAGSGGLSFPTGLTMGPNGNLFVSSRNTNSVIQYNGTTGVPIGTFVASGSGGLFQPYGLVFGPNGDLFVTSSNQVMEYNGTTGAFVRVFVSSGNNGGLAAARGLVFKPDGNLLVASYATDAILQYQAGTGMFLGKWNSGGTTSALYLDGPWGLRIGPTGNVFCTRDLPSAEDFGDHHDDGDLDQDRDTAELHVTSVRILEFDITNGKYFGAYILGDDTGLRSPTGFDFMPTTGDCDFNLLPDSCDFANCADPGCGDCNGNALLDRCDLRSGLSADSNANLMPDECENPSDVLPDSPSQRTRGLTFSAPPLAAASAPSGQSAIRVTMVDLQNPVPANPLCCPPPDFSAYESATCTAGGETAGCGRWLGRPKYYLESQGNPALGAAKFARLQCTPFYHDWSAEGPVDVVGAELVPSSAYDVTVFSSICKGNEGSCAITSAPVRINTRRAGDIASNFNPPATTPQPDAIDIASMVNRFQNKPGSPRKIVAKVQPNVIDPHEDVNALDIVAVVDNFRGWEFRFSGPCACPSSVTCNSTACASDATCGGGKCVKTCTAGPRVGESCITTQHCGECAGGVRQGWPCDADADCPASTCNVGTCGSGFCRDRCGRCN